MKRLAAVVALVVVVAAGCSATTHTATPTGISILQQRSSFDVYRNASVTQLSSREKAACNVIATARDVPSGVTAVGVNEMKAGASAVDARLFLVAAAGDACPQYFTMVRALLEPTTTTG
jgi:hypothetical protein